MIATGSGIARRILDRVDTLREVLEPPSQSTTSGAGAVRNVLEHLHNLAPATFPEPSFGYSISEKKSPVMDAITYMKSASLEMLSVHDSYVPSCLRDMYKAYLLSQDQEKCRSMSVVFNMMCQSRARLIFYKDIAQLAFGMVTSKIPRLLPLDRGIRSMDVSINDVFNDMSYRTHKLSGGDIFAANTTATRPENPYIRMLRNLILEGLREFAGNTDKRLFKEHATYNDTDRALLEAYTKLNSATATSEAELHQRDVTIVPTIATVVEEDTLASSSVQKIISFDGISNAAAAANRSVLLQNAAETDDANSKYFKEENRVENSKQITRKVNEETTIPVNTSAVITEDKDASSQLSYGDNAATKPRGYGNTTERPRRRERRRRWSQQQQHQHQQQQLQQNSQRFRNSTSSSSTDSTPNLRKTTQWTEEPITTLQNDEDSSSLTTTTKHCRMITKCARGYKHYPSSQISASSTSSQSSTSNQSSTSSNYRRNIQTYSRMCNNSPNGINSPQLQFVPKMLNPTTTTNKVTEATTTTAATTPVMMMSYEKMNNTEDSILLQNVSNLTITLPKINVIMHPILTTANSNDDICNNSSENEEYVSVRSVETLGSISQHRVTDSEIFFQNVSLTRR